MKMKSIAKSFVVVLLGLAVFGCSLLGDTTTPATLAVRTISPSLESSPLPSASLPSPAPPNGITSIPTGTPTPGLDYFSQIYPLSQDDYVIPLTVRHVTEQSATFFFELPNLSGGSLVYRSTDPKNPTQGEVIILAGETRHMITLEGLSPGVPYQVMVLISSEEGDLLQPGFSGKEWGAVDFRTASGETPLRIGVLGDASFGDQATEQLVALMATLDLDFVIHTGDVVYETDGSDLYKSYLVKFFEPFAPLLHQLPVYTVLGNHDYDPAVRWQEEPFYDVAFPPFPSPDFSYPESRRGNQYYAFTYQDIQFLMLDSQVFFGIEGRAEQEAWLAERLADPRFRITIPVFHVAPYSSSVVHPADGLPVRYTWNPLFEASNVPLSLSGHFHHYERLSANGITYIVSGGGSSTLYAQGDQLPESHIYARRTHFVRMEIFKDRIELCAISLEAETFDQVTIPLD